MSEKSGERPELEEILKRVKDTVLPSEIDRMARELSAPIEAAHALVQSMSEGKYIKECYQLLIRLNVKDVVEDLERLLDSPNPLVQRYAMYTLIDQAEIQQSPRLRSALYGWLNQIAYPPSEETDAIETVKAVERLVRTGPVEAEVADRLQAILFFIPQGSYRELFWPRTWIKASRLLRDSGFIHKLEEVARSQNRHYLSAAGAIALAVNGIMEASIDEWLKNSRDYSLLTSSERQELERLLLKLGNAEQELLLLRSVNSRT